MVFEVCKQFIESGFKGNISEVNLSNISEIFFASFQAGITITTVGLAITRYYTFFSVFKRHEDATNYSLISLYFKGIFLKQRGHFSF